MIHALVGLLAAAVMAVPTGTDVDYQLGGAVEPPANVGIVVRDRTDPPVAGRFNVCYVNGFQTQPNEKRFWAKHPALVLRDADGRPVVDEAWGEFLLDVRTAAKRKALARIVGRWVRGCAHDGYAAVEKSIRRSGESMAASSDRDMDIGCMPQARVRRRARPPDF